ncbi:MAG: hypothetical protein J1E96_04965 [Ruminococcus sp.]|nr:hypothetical protein [Ruminococcus sp.]
MHRLKYSKKQITAHNILYRTAGILLVFALFSAWLLCGLYAKYIVSSSNSDSARVAKGIEKVEVIEHKVRFITDEKEAVEKDSVYELLSGTANEEHKGIEYSVVLPGVDIPKDPFVRVAGTSEMSLQLCIKIVETNLPNTVTYDIRTDDWTEDPKGSKIYKYKDVINSDFKKDIYILKDNQIKVSEKYVGNGTFSLAFEAWLEQVD